jgi:hypothetical protein
MSLHYKKIFFDTKNFESLLESINNLFNSRYNLKNEDKKKCIEIMKALSTNNKNLENQNISIQEKVYLLNVNTIQIMKEYIEEKIGSHNSEIYNVNGTMYNQNEEQKEIHMPDSLVGVDSTKLNNNDINKDLESILKLRESEKIIIKKQVEKKEETEKKELQPFIENNNLQDFDHVDENMIEQTKENMEIKPKEKYSKMMQDIKDDRKFMSIYEVIVDSKDRNYTNYPNPNYYIVDLDQTYKDVVSIELISSIVPKSQYIINSNNNTIYFNEGGSDLTATITEGNYTISTLLAALKSSMDTVGGLTYTLTNDTLTNKITISATGTFSLLFDGGEENYLDGTRTVYKENSIGPIIGFPRSDLSGASTYTAPNQYNLNGENYVLLEIKDLENLNSSIAKNTINKNFCKINLDVDNNSNKFFTNKVDYICKKYFKEVLPKLSQFNIKFYNYNGSLYDFNGLEHSLHFRIKTLNINNQIISHFD